MKSARLIAMVALAASAACSNAWDSEFRGDDEPVCEANDVNNPIEITTTTIELWPPNHEMQAIGVAECAEVVACDPEWTAEILWVSSDEPAEGEHDGDDCEDDDDDEDDHDDDEDDDDDDDDDDGEDDDDDGEDDDEDDDDDDDDDEDDDDGNATSSEDITFIGPDTVELRAERDGGGNGRVYTIAFVIRDAGGNEAESSCTVTVPHDQGKDGETIDDGEAYRVEP